jgi:hypothetical protein
MSRFPGLLGAVLAAAGAVAGPVVGTAPAHAAGTSAAGTSAAAPPPVERVVLVGVAGLRWSDVSDRTPTLARLVRGGSVGALSVRAAPAPPRVTCPAEGWLTVGAGNYAAVLDPTGPETAGGCAGRHPAPVSASGGVAAAPPAAAPPAAAPPAAAPPAGAVTGWARIRKLNAGLRFGAGPGLLGGAVPCTVAVGQGAALAVAGATGHVDAYAERLPAAPDALLRRCPLAAVDLGTLPPDGPARDDALAAVDAELSIVDAHLPARTVLAVLGLADTGEDGPHLHVAAVTGPGFTGGWLRSASTRRTPYVQLSDVAPTVLSLLGIRPPAGANLAGAVLTGGAPGRPSTVDETVAALTDTDVAANAQRRSLPLFAVAVALLWLLAVVASASPLPMLVCCAVPGATFLANLVPWWRAPMPALAVTCLVVGLAAAVAWVASRGPWKRAGALAVAGFTALVLTVDAVTGTALQINSLLGYNPLVAGRFTGFGNLAFAVYGAAGLLLAALLAHRFERPRVAVAVVLAVAVPLVVVDGLPAWGADFGGVLTLVPAFAVLALLAGRARVNAARLAAAGLGAVAVVAAIAVADYLRPADERSHFGRFVAAVLDGTAGATLERKLAANLDLLVAGPHTYAALGLVLLVTWCVVRPPSALAATFAAVPGARPAAVAVAVLGWLGFATNDSGVAVPLLVALVAVPAVLSLRPLAAHASVGAEPSGP